MAVSFTGLRDAFIITGLGGLSLGGAYVIGSQIYKSASSVHFSAKAMRFDSPLILFVSVLFKAVIFGLFNWKEETFKDKLLGTLIVFSSAFTLYEIAKSGANGNKLAAHLVTALATSLAALGAFGGMMLMGRGLKECYQAFRR